MLRKTKALAAAAAVTGAIALVGATSASALLVGSFNGPFPGSGAMAAPATAGASRIVVNGVHGLAAYNCTATAWSAGLNTGTFSVPVTVGSSVPTFSTCTGPAGLAFVITCGSTPLEFTSGLSGGFSQGRLTGISCAMLHAGTGCFGTLSGAVPLRYVNPAGLVPGVATVQTAGQTLNVSGSWCPTTVLSDGSAQLGAPSGSGAGLANLPFTLTGTPGDHPFVV